MRMTANRGLLKRVYIEVTNEDHQRLHQHAAQKRRSVASIVADWITPQIAALPAPSAAESC